MPGYRMGRSQMNLTNTDIPGTFHRRYEQLLSNALPTPRGRHTGAKLCGVLVNSQMDEPDNTLISTCHSQTNVLLKVNTANVRSDSCIRQ